MTKEFKLTQKQQEAQAVLASDATHEMLFGGSRSGKTFLHVRNTILRALKAPGSRHAILRFRFNHIKSSIIFDTFPKVMKTAFPGIKYTLNKTDWFATLPNGSEIWFGGLDDKERTEKILGNEYVTIYLNECSQIPLGGRNIVVTRLAQLVDVVIDGINMGPMKPRMFYDCNPPTKAHWAYKMFIRKEDPETKKPFKHPEDYCSFKMNPVDNKENLSPQYLQTLNGLSERLQKRFVDGEFADDNPDALFTDDNFAMYRTDKADVPQLQRVVVAVDPSGSGDTDNQDNDAIGIVVAGIGVDGNAYVLQDCTVKAGPAVWGRVAVEAFDRHMANSVVGETNYGGAMVEYVVKASRANTPFIKVTASRGKAVRAEPISTLYDQGKVRHVGGFPELEDELCDFSTYGYIGDRSPNRADALVWAITALFPNIMNAQRKQPEVTTIPYVAPFAKNLD